MTVVLVLVGGAVGAPLRYLTDLLIQSRNTGLFPWGTFVVNVAGSLVLGIAASAVLHAGVPSWVSALVATGFCGALTTFSTFGFETFRLIEDGAWRVAGLNVGASLLAGMTAFVAGWELARLLG